MGLISGAGGGGGGGRVRREGGCNGIYFSVWTSRPISGCAYKQ